MHDSFLNFIRGHSITPLGPGEIELIKRTFVHKKIRKHQYFLQEGKVCKYLGFIVRGAMRQYSVDDKGMEHIVRLAIENWWVGDRESYINLTASIYNIDAWEDTDLLLVTRADQLSELRLIPALNEMAQTLDENFAIATQKRLNSHVSMPAEKRYAEFSKAYPEFLQRFPQHIIASYLGITKETLSRIRSHGKKK